MARRTKPVRKLRPGIVKAASANHRYVPAVTTSRQSSNHQICQLSLIKVLLWLDMLVMIKWWGIGCDPSEMHIAVCSHTQQVQQSY